MVRTAVLLVVVLGLQTALHAQNKSNRKDEQRENQRVNEAKQALQKIQREWNSAVKGFRQEEVDVRQAVVKLRSSQVAYNEAREAAEEQLEESSGLPELIRKMRSVRDEISAVSKPLLDQLHTKEIWQTLNRKAIAAEKERELLLDNPDHTEQEIKEQIASLDQQIAAPGKLDSETVDSDPRIKLLKVDYHKAISDIAKLRQKMDSTQIDSLPQVQSAKANMESAQRALAGRRKQLAESNGQLAKRRTALLKAHAALQQVQIADQNDRNQNKPNKRK
jgi:hypothetical protein